MGNDKGYYPLAITNHYLVHMTIVFATPSFSRAYD